ncbi:nodulation protein NfeD [Roseomonas sp. M0104]|uniref:Nodulation protein NfeD n=1 Tax=Teichococcus coralli TaxID=2545983 RepID=A0A845B8N4_9PROT|nr:nodulation protein NfeD [Pseudoroseomonas coralli]MXP62466.1 nodulation protein NfeD [Pseudoroseomonas coralli]
MRGRALLVALALLLPGPLPRSIAAEPARTALLLSVEGGIGPGVAGYVEAGLARAAGEGTALVVLRLDTPGGLDAAMRRIVQAMLASPVPVAAWVAPRGARAASAGLLILSAAQVAAMAPGTATGAATPVLLGGGQEGDRDPMRAKRVNDAAAYARGLAEYHGRNPDWLEKAVREAASVPAEEAVRLGVADFVAADLPALLATMEGRRVRMPSGPLVLETSGLAVERLDPGWRDRLLTAISDPNIAYLLLMIGLGGLILEVAAPGFGLGGVVGGIALLLGLFALNLLPVDLTGLALMALGAAMLVAEAFIPAFGLLGFGGLAALVLGAVIAFDFGTPGFALSPVVVVSSAALLALLLAATMWSVLRARRRAVRTGAQGMIGAAGRVLEWSGRSGTVLVHGERWSASAPAALAPGQPVRVMARQGLRLTVAADAAEQEGKTP